MLFMYLLDIFYVIYMAILILMDNLYIYNIYVHGLLSR